MTSPSNALRTGEKRLALASFASVTLLIVIFLLRDASAFVNSAQDELIGHLGASGGFTLAATGTYLVLRRERPALHVILLIGAAITVAAELAQGLVPDRGIELQDIATGFGGVLVAGLCIESILRVLSRLAALRVHTVVASIASVILFVLLVFDLAPETISGASPDGASCPLTTIDGTGQRMIIGPNPAIIDECLRTTAGGLGLFAPAGSGVLNDESVLLSSPLDRLAERIEQSGGVTILAEFVTEDFDDEDVRLPGILVALRSEEAGELLQIRMRNRSVEVFGPNFPHFYRSSSAAQVLEPNTQHRLRVELTNTQLAVYIDGDPVATSTVNPDWFDAFVDSEAAEDLTLYLGNLPSRIRPFHGVIEWVEIDT